jgi:large subunit ribosomal protein L1
MGKGKRLTDFYKGIDRETLFELPEAVRLVKEAAGGTKADQTIEIAMNLGVDPRHSDQMVRGVVSLPHGTGKTIRVAVFAKDAKADEAKAAGADFIGAEDLMKEIQDGKSDFDRVIATPDMMAVVGRLGKVLGPRGLMPNPKLGTVTTNVKKAVEDAKAGELEYKTSGIVIHSGVGKSKFNKDELVSNIKFFVETISKDRPAGVKGEFIKAVSISPTMGPGIKLDLGSLGI